MSSIVFNALILKRKRLWVSVRLYRTSQWGKRVLGEGRMAYDAGYVSLIVENWRVHDRRNT